MTAMERVVEEAGGTLWFQLYLWPERDLSSSWSSVRERPASMRWCSRSTRRWPPGREYNLRNGFVISVPLHASQRDRRGDASALAVRRDRPLPAHRRPAPLREFPSHMQTRFTALPMGRSMATNPSMSWDDVRALRRLWPRTLIVKGIQHAEDARMAADLRCRMASWSPTTAGECSTARRHRSTPALGARRGGQADDGARGQRVSPRRRRGQGAGDGRARRCCSAARRSTARRWPGNRARCARSSSTATRSIAVLGLIGCRGIDELVSAASGDALGRGTAPAFDGRGRSAPVIAGGRARRPTPGFDRRAGSAHARPRKRRSSVGLLRSAAGTAQEYSPRSPCDPPLRTPRWPFRSRA
jgi:hypothetical protein